MTAAEGSLVLGVFLIIIAIGYHFQAHSHRRLADVVKMNTERMRRESLFGRNLALFLGIGLLSVSVFTWILEAFSK